MIAARYHGHIAALLMPPVLTLAAVTLARIYARDGYLVAMLALLALRMVAGTLWAHGGGV